MRRGNRERFDGGLSTVIGAAILTVITVILGVLLFGIAMGWLSATSNESTSEVGQEVLKIQSYQMLSIEYINYTVETHLVNVRNLAKIPLTITRIELWGENGLIDSIPNPGYTNITKLQRSESATLEIPYCSDCELGENLLLRIWYIASALYRENIVESIDEMTFIETSFINNIGTIASECPLPETYLVIDVVDPITLVDSGEILPEPFNIVYIRSPLTNMLGTADFQVNVEGANGMGVGYSSYSIPSNNLIRVQGNYEGIRGPLNITISSHGYGVLPRGWSLGYLEGRVHVSGVRIIWSGADKLVRHVEVQLGFAQPGTYRVSIELLDCNKNLIGYGEKHVNLPPDVSGEASIIEIIGLENAVKIEQIYYVEVTIHGS